MDQIILAKDCVLENGGLRSGLNENVAVVGGTGSGKTFSTCICRSGKANCTEK